MFFAIMFLNTQYFNIIRYLYPVMFQVMLFPYVIVPHFVNMGFKVNSNMLSPKLGSLAPNSG